MKRIENHMAKKVRWVDMWEPCHNCWGTGTVPLNVNDLDDEREIECAQCNGEGGHEIKVEEERSL